MSYIGDKFKLLTESKSDCGFLSIVDVTPDYALIEAGTTRDDFGIAIFASHDNFTTVHAHDLSNNDQWYLDVDNGKTYRVHAFLAAKWVFGTSYANEQIVWSDERGKFYQSNSATSSHVPGYDSEWLELDESNYTDFEDRFVNDIDDYGYTEYIHELNCLLFNVNKVGYLYERTYQFVNNSGLTISGVTLYEYDGTLVGLLSESESVYSMTLNKDYTYYIQFTDENDELYQVVFHVLDGIRYAIDQLSNDVLCEWDDTNCSPGQEDMKAKYSIMVIHTLFLPLLMDIHRDVSEGYGVYSIDQNRLSDITKICSKYDKINLIIDNLNLD